MSILPSFVTNSATPVCRTCGSQKRFAGQIRSLSSPPANLFWDPQVRHTGVAEFVTQLGKIDIYRGEENECFAFGFVLDSDNCDQAFVFSRKAQQIDDLLFDGFVRNHFAADL